MTPTDLRALRQRLEKQHMENIPEFSEPRFFVLSTTVGYGVFYRQDGRQLGVGCAQNVERAVAQNVATALNAVVDEEVEAALRSARGGEQ